MADGKVDSRRLALLDDCPAGASRSESVAFSYGLYGELLRDALLSNRPGLCVGFFARWGQGKSTVVNLLSGLLGDQAKLTIFNAYQARGDSVRRQMLLSVLSDIDPKTADEFKRFSQTITPLEFQTAAVQRHFSGFNVLKLIMLEKKADPILILSALGAIGFSFAYAAAGLQMIFTNVSSEKMGVVLVSLGGMVVSCVGYILRKFKERKDKILAYSQPVSDSQRLKYPEQFADVFANAVDEFCKKTSKRLIIVVDDLDRCDPSTVVEALASIRQFCHLRAKEAFNCQFLIPCDEGQMILALEADGYAVTQTGLGYHNYSKTEMLRKFFDVVVRMDEIVPESLADFAADQAQRIGVSPELARDIIDAAAIREPRKVKAILNALRVAHEAVKRSHEQSLLPNPVDLDRFDHTLALLVCFQELAPTAFAQVSENPDILLQEKLPDTCEKVAQRFFAMFGPVSATTADVLITKQNEPSLLGLPQSYSISAAIRADQAEEVLRIISEANDSEQQRLVGFLLRKLVDARSGVRLKQLIGYILDFGCSSKWAIPIQLGFIGALRKQRRFLPDALRLGSRLEALAAYSATLGEPDRQFINHHVLQNYLSAPDVMPDEEKYVLRFANQLESVDRQKLRNSLEQGLLAGHSVIPTRLSKCFDSLPPAGESGCFGFAPELGVKLLMTLRSVHQDYHQACLSVGLCLIGSDSGAAASLLTFLVTAQVFSRPQDLSDEFARSYGVYFELLHGLLASQNSFEEFQSFYDAQYREWMQHQSRPESRKRLLSCIQPGWGFLSTESLTGIGNVVGEWLLHDVEFAKICAATIDSPGRELELWKSHRDELRNAVFQMVCQLAESDPVLTAELKEFFSSVKSANWDVKQAAENLLEKKVRRVRSGVSHRPRSIMDWFDALVPLCDPKLNLVATAIRETLSQNSDPAELIKFALRTVWSGSIPEDCATPLALALLANPGVVTSEQDSAAFATRAGFSEVARILLNHIPSQTLDWKYNNGLFLGYLANWVAGDQDLLVRFQTQVADALLTANRDEYFAAGLQLLKNHERIHPNVKRSIDGWLKTKSGSKDLVSQAVGISRRRDL